MATVVKRDDRESWEVRWRELVVSLDEHGIETRTWKSRRKRVPTERVGKALAREIESAQALGSAWVDERQVPKATLGSISAGWITASQHRAADTGKYRASLLQKFIDWAGEDEPVTKLSAPLLLAYAAWLPTAGVRSVARYVGTVEQVWAWAANKADRFPGVPSPVRVTGNDNEIPHAVSPVAVDTPTWEDVDRMIHALTPEGSPSGCGQGHGYRPQWALHRRVALFQRYSGLRVSQILSLTWDDLDLRKQALTLRSTAKGAKNQRRTRVVPLHPALVELLGDWAGEPGAVFARIATKGARRGQPVVPTNGEVAEVFTGAWQRAGIEESKWGAVERLKARPTNAIRARWKSTLAGASSYELATLMLGQAAEHGEHDAYVAMGTPEASPYWLRMQAAILAVPRPMTNV